MTETLDAIVLTNLLALSPRDDQLLYLDKIITTARAEGFAAGEASMREKAKEACRKYYAANGSELVDIIDDIPPSSPAIWTAGKEREAVVVALRKWGDEDKARGTVSVPHIEPPEYWLATRIERGDHLPAPPKETKT